MKKANDRKPVRSDQAASPEPAEERGERIATGRRIARGGKTKGAAGATAGADGSHSDPVAPLDPSLSSDEQKKQALAIAVAQIGEHASPAELADIIRKQVGIEMSESEVAALQQPAPLGSR
jgi:hypothetical protein